MTADPAAALAEAIRRVIANPHAKTETFANEAALRAALAGGSVTFSPSHVLAVFTDCTSVTKDF